MQDKILKPSQEFLREILDYDAETGFFTWKVRRNKRIEVGARAGRREGNGYRYLGIDGKSYLEHRLVWVYVHGEQPKEQIDHINGIKDDNRISNLRAATALDNVTNRPITKRSKSGVMGVRWIKDIGKWEAAVFLNRKKNTLGYYLDFFEAVCARKSAERKMGFHANHGRKPIYH